jgi:hypothetical protein
MFNGKPVEKQGHKVTGLRGSRKGHFPKSRMIAGLPKLIVLVNTPLRQSHVEGLGFFLIFTHSSGAPHPIGIVNASSWRRNAFEHI